MSQYDFGNLSSPLNGADFFDNKLEPWRTALHSMHSGSTRPTYAIAQMLWCDTTTTPWIIKMFTGSVDIVIGTVNTTTGKFVVGGGAQSNLAATTNPTVSNDSTQGYSAGSRWLNTITGSEWFAQSVAAGAAIWVKLFDSSQTIAVANGGTGGTTQATARAGIAAAASGANADITSIVGVTAGTNAPAGAIGEFATAQATSALTTGTPLTLTSLTLQAGDYELWGKVYFSGTGTTTIQQMTAAINTTTNVLPANTDMSYNRLTIATTGGQADQGLLTGRTRVNISTATTYYLVTQASFAVSTLSATGTLNARRMR